jgi:protein-tyrosine phosphatase
MTTTPEKTPRRGGSASRGTPEARTVEIPGVYNARDLGGLTTARGTIRPGLLLRSGSYEELTEQGAEVLARLGVRTIIDLRLNVEREVRPSRIPDFPALAGITEVRIPLVPDFEGSPDTPDGSYVFLVDRGAPSIGAVIARLAAPRALPAVVHCAAGKDRTGVVVAALLSTLGVPLGQVHADYLRSNETLGERLIYPAHASALDAALARMTQTAGSVEGFLEQHGVAPEALAALHAELLDPA